MKSRDMGVTFTRCTDIDEATIIKQLGDNLLFTPAMYEQSNPKEREKWAQKGFVIGVHSLSTIKKWISDSRNYLILGWIQKSPKSPQKPFGFAVLLNSDKIIKQVQGYAKKVNFRLENVQNVIQKENFIYLIQIGVDFAYQNLGLGSQLFSECFSQVSKPLISFVIKSPLINYPSLYTHLKNGFQCFGEYWGSYATFEDYRSYGLIHYPQVSIPPASEVKSQFHKLIGKSVD